MLFDKLTCVKIEKNHFSAAPSACDFQKVYLRSITCCNKCQVNLILFQRFDKMFLLSSSPKVGICSNRCNLHISSFLRIVPVAWIIEKHCNKIIEPAANKYVGHTQGIYNGNGLYWYIRRYISLDLCILFLIAKFYQAIIKRKKLAWIFLKEQCYEEQCFDNTTWKEFSSVVDRPMFPNMSKTFCHFGRLGTWNLMDVFSNVFTE